MAISERRKAIATPRTAGISRRSVLATTLACLMTPVLHAAPRLLIGRDGNSSPLADVSQAIMIKAYSTLGISLEFRYIPLRRSLALANAGQLDGELMRIAVLADLSPQLLQIPVAINRLDVQSFHLGKLNITTWEDLRPYRIGYIPGILVIERPLKGFNTVEIADYVDGFRQLQAGMIDVVVGLGMETAPTFARFKGSGIMQSPTILGSEPLYHYLHKRHSRLVSPLTAALKSMLASGEIEQIRQSYLSQVIKANQQDQTSKSPPP